MSKEKSFDFGVFLVGIFSTAISIFLLVFDDCTGRANDFYCSHPVFSYFCLICCVIMGVVCLIAPFIEMNRIDSVNKSKEQVTNKESVKMNGIYCALCGEKNAIDNLFCTSCGTKIITAKDINEKSSFNSDLQTNSKFLACNDCKKLISKEATTCPHCGATTTKGRNKLAITVSIFLVCFAVYKILLILVDYNFESEKNRLEFQREIHRAK